MTTHITKYEVLVYKHDSPYIHECRKHYECDRDVDDWQELELRLNRIRCEVTGHHWQQKPVCLTTIPPRVDKWYHCFRCLTPKEARR